MFYTFRQNNSGGVFHVDAMQRKQVVIEADNPASANLAAELRAGLYFDGARDCSCCGNRWSEQYPDDEDEGTSVPASYSVPFLLLPPDLTSEAGYIPNAGDAMQPDVVVHYADGTKVYGYDYALMERGFMAEEEAPYPFAVPPVVAAHFKAQGWREVPARYPSMGKCVIVPQPLLTAGDDPNAAIPEAEYEVVEE